MFRSQSGVGIYSAKTGVESESKILDSVHHWRRLAGLAGWRLTANFTLAAGRSGFQDSDFEDNPVGYLDWIWFP